MTKRASTYNRGDSSDVPPATLESSSCLLPILLMVTVLLTVGTILAVGLLFLGGGGGTLIEEPTPTPLPTPTPTPSFEITQDTAISRTDRLGEISIEYPLRMSPGSSDSVRVSIYIPVRLASLIPLGIERIEIPPDAPKVIGELNSHQAVIIVTETMRVDLSSPTFKVENLYPLKQKLNLDSVNEATLWAWTIVAPITIGTHVLTLRVLSGDSDTPNWVGNIKVEVAELEQPSPILPWVIVLLMVIIGLVGFLGTKGRLPISPFTRKDHLQREIMKWTRRLQGLKEKKATLGLAADPSLDIEIEEIEAKIEELQTELAQVN